MLGLPISVFILIAFYLLAQDNDRNAASIREAIEDSKDDPNADLDIQDAKYYNNED